MPSRAESDFQRAQTGAVLFGPCKLPMWRISGRDATRYLHGRITQNVKGLAPGQSARSLVITPQGKIQGQFLLYREAESFLLVSDALSSKAAVDEFISALLQFKVADDVVLEDLSGALAVYSAIGPDAESLAEKIASGEQIILPHRWGKLPGFDILAAPGSVAHETADPAALEMIRISEKVPRMEADLSEKILAPEIDVTEVVSFDKGCYAGQEVVEMAAARGRPNRMLVLFEGRGERAPESGTEIFSEGGESKSIGWLTSSCVFPSEGTFRALGFVKTAAAESAVVGLERIG